MGLTKVERRHAARHPTFTQRCALCVNRAECERAQQAAKAAREAARPEPPPRPAPPPKSTKWRYQRPRTAFGVGRTHGEQRADSYLAMVKLVLRGCWPEDAFRIVSEAVPDHGWCDEERLVVSLLEKVIIRANAARELPGYHVVARSQLHGGRS